MHTAGLSRVIHGFGIFALLLLFFKRFSPRDRVISSIAMAAEAFSCGSQSAVLGAADFVQPVKTQNTDYSITYK